MYDLTYKINNNFSNENQFHNFVRFFKNNSKPYKFVKYNKYFLNCWSDVVLFSKKCKEINPFFCNKSDEILKIERFIGARSCSDETLSDWAWMSGGEIRSGLKVIINYGEIETFRKVCRALSDNCNIYLPSVVSMPYAFLEIAMFEAIDAAKRNKKRSEHVTHIIEIAKRCLTDGQENACKLAVLGISKAAEIETDINRNQDFMHKDRSWCRHISGWFDDQKHIVRSIRYGAGDGSVSLIRNIFAELIINDPMTAAYISYDYEKFKDIFNGDDKISDACFESMVVHVEARSNNIKNYMLKSINNIVDYCSLEQVSRVCIDNKFILQIDKIRSIHEKYILENTVGLLNDDEKDSSGRSGGRMF